MSRGRIMSGITICACNASDCTVGTIRAEKTSRNASAVIDIYVLFLSVANSGMLLIALISVCDNSNVKS